MSTDLIQEQIKRFVSTETPEVLAIKGDWGVGKTYCWDKHIEAFKNECALKSYAYVSLFGINSIDALKQATFLNTIDTKDIGKKHNIKTLSKQWAPRLKSIKIPFINDYISGFGEVFNSISQLAVKDTIICFDDLERKSDDLSIKDFMGLVSFFKDRKNCKVVLLLNEDAGDETFKDYRKYKEKIIDRQLHFQPTAKESFDTMFEADFEFRSYVRDCCIGLDITNKRIVSKIVNHTRDFLPLVDTFDEEIKKQVIHSTIVLCWCYYCHAADPHNIPEFDFVNRSGVRRKDEDRGWTDEQVKRWNNLLNSYGYQWSDEIDLVVAKAIEQGFINRASLIPLCESKQQEIDVRNSNAKWDEAWKLFHGSFDSNEEDIAKAMEMGMRDIAASTSCSQYSSGLKVLRELGEDKIADELIDFFVDARKGNPEIFNVDSIVANPFSIEDEKFIAALREAYLKFEPKPTVESILQKRRGSNSYNMSEVEVLNELSTEQIEELFRQFKGEELTTNIRTFMLLSSSNAELGKKVGHALDNIASTNLNKSRMAKFRH